MAKKKEITKERYSGTANPDVLKVVRKYTDKKRIPFSIFLEGLMSDWVKNNSK